MDQHCNKLSSSIYFYYNSFIIRLINSTFITYWKPFSTSSIKWNIPNNGPFTFSKFNITIYSQRYSTKSWYMTYLNYYAIYIKYFIHPRRYLSQSIIYLLYTIFFILLFLDNLSNFHWISNYFLFLICFILSYQ